MQKNFGSRLLALTLAASLLASCASTNKQTAINTSSAAAETSIEIEPTVVAYNDYDDPLMGLNRAIFSFNNVSYRYVLIPLSKGYIKVVPDPVRQGVSNFFYNIKAPIYLINNTLQLEFGDAGTNLLRFGINSTLGLLGIFDPAKDWFGIEKAHADFEGTLAEYGVGYGVYLVLPLLGPSDLRNGTSAIASGFLHPVSWLVENPERYAIQGFDYFQDFAPDAEAYTTLYKKSDDPYIFFRNFYLQGIQRDAEYHD